MTSCGVQGGTFGVRNNDNNEHSTRRAPDDSTAAAAHHRSSNKCSCASCSEGAPDGRSESATLTAEGSPLLRFDRHL